MQKSWIVGGKLCIALFGAFALSACGTGYQTLRLGDRALLPSARVSRGLYRADRALAPSDVQTELALEGGLLGTSGSTPTFLYATALVGDQTFTAPQTINTDFDFKAADASLHWRHAFLNRRIGYDSFAGLGWTMLNFSASSSTIQGTESFSSAALRVGVGAFWRVYKETSLEAEGTSLPGNDAFSMGGRRFSVVQKLGRHVTVNGGYFSWRVGTSGASRSRIEIHSQGPAAGIKVKF
jgi:hypothetical protein